MKRQHVFLISLFTLFGLMMTNCEKDEKDDECAKTAMPEITRGFSIDIIVMTKDSVPWTGPVTMKFWKEYCNEEISGEYSFNGYCDHDGYYYPNSIPTYILANSEDCVFVNVELKESNAPSFWWSPTYEYYYEDVYPLITGVEETYTIYLWWNSASK